VSEWKPIDTAPKDGTGFLAFERISETHYTISVCVWENGPEGEGPYMVLFHDKHNVPINATHWMPQPEPPKETP
jgi:hypothetical protein